MGHVPKWQMTMSDKVYILQMFLGLRVVWDGRRQQSVVTSLLLRYSAGLGFDSFSHCLYGKVCIL